MASNNNTSNLPRVILGTMTFGLEDSTSEASVVRVRGVDNVKPFLETFHAHGYIEIDTARIYCNGDTEKVLSQLPTAHFKISTKVYPITPGAHDAVELPKQFRRSLEALNAKKVDILYLHAPDFATPFEVTIKAVNELYREGLFERFGLSNYASWQVALIHELCKQNDYVLPTVYQGMYNPIARSVVPELLPCLKHFNIGFYAYNPVGGGLLTGKYKFDQDKVEEGSRYDPKTGFGKFFRERYWNNLNFEGVQILDKAAKENKLTLLEATLRWMRHHSGLEAKDGIILGASSVKHLEENLADLEKGPLPQAMLDAFDRAWEHVKPTSQSYYNPSTSRLRFKLENTD
ncbi:Aldo/keto reductase [Gamsiella multidivaricata]|uniref:Aldo/keto reductase n=1 Tax=Gamsiella multidivaricata TaxID=101098 RepID=UPI00221FE455|nr:Aldo/keto reductase [Gamsiella multidivaricata]KAI7828105.1 Aldo/keto reductase [Gamsiella multidivaricata]